MTYIRTCDKSQSLDIFRPNKASVWPNRIGQTNLLYITNRRVSLKIMNVWTIFSPYDKHNISYTNQNNYNTNYNTTYDADKLLL